MNVSFYTIDDLRLPAKRLLKKGWTMERFSTLEAALSNYRALPDSGIKALGLTDGAHILEVLRKVEREDESRGQEETEEGSC